MAPRSRTSCDVRRETLVRQHLLEPRIGFKLGAVQLAHAREVEQVGDDAVAALDVAIDAAQAAARASRPLATTVSRTVKMVLRMALSGLRSSCATVAVS